MMYIKWSTEKVHNDLLLHLLPGVSLNYLGTGNKIGNVCVNFGN